MAKKDKLKSDENVKDNQINNHKRSKSVGDDITLVSFANGGRRS